MNWRVGYQEDEAAAWARQWGTEGADGDAVSWPAQYQGGVVAARGKR